MSNYLKKLKLDEKFSDISELDSWLNKLSPRAINKKGTYIKYFNTPSSFDIETTSFTDEFNMLKSTMYLWSVSIYGKCFYGRYWFEFLQLLNIIKENLELSDERRFVFYIQNLTHEFAFLKTKVKIKEVFNTKKTILNFVTDDGFEFRDSQALFDGSLEEMGNSLKKYKVKKQVGDLDYYLIRHSETPLTEKELNYSLCDVQVVVAYITEMLEEFKSIANMPCTSRTIVRRELRQIMRDDKSTRRLLNNLTIDDEEIEVLLKANHFGYLHCKDEIKNKTFFNVHCRDEKSAYPYALLLPLYPVSKGKKCDIYDESDFRRYLKDFACLFRIKIYEVSAKQTYEYTLESGKRLYDANNVVLNNRKIVSADYIELSMTDIDFNMFEKFYDYDRFEIIDFWFYKRGYLPKPFIKYVIKLFNEKQSYPEGTPEYERAKVRLNCLYGMCVESWYFRESFVFQPETIDWKQQSKENAVEDYNASKKRFLNHTWGVWCVSIGRMLLQNAILELKDDYLYSNTDSVWYLNEDAHKEFFDTYFNDVKKNLINACEYVGENMSVFENTDTILGFFEYKGFYKRFKAIGTNRYIKEDAEGNIEIKITSANGNKMLEYMKEQCNNENDKIFVMFDVGTIIPKEYSGRTGSETTDTPFMYYLTDYLGNSLMVCETSCIAIYGQPYEFRR